MLLLAARLFGLSKDDLLFLLGTFDVLRRNEIKALGTFRTERLVREAWEEV